MGNLTLGSKVTICLGVLTFLIIALGSISLTSITVVNATTGKMADVFLPQINLAEQLITNVLKAQREFDNYYVSKNPESYDRTEELLNVVDRLIQQGFDLSREKALGELKTDLEGLKTGLEKFRTAVDNLMAANRGQDEIQMQLAKKNRVLLLVFPKVMEQANLDLAQALSSASFSIDGARKAVFQLVTMYQVFSDYTIIRGANQKSHTQGDPNLIKNEFPRIERMQKAVSLLRGQTEENNENPLTTLQKEFNSLREVVNRDIQAEAEKVKTLDQMNLAANETLKITTLIIEKSLQSAQSGAKETDKIVNTAGNLLKIGLLLAILFSGTMSMLLSWNVSAILQSLQKETQKLTQGALSGNLEIRGNTELINREFRPILEGFNQVLEALIRPLKMAGNYVQRISTGDIPPVISEEFQGGFNDNKTSLNQLIEAMTIITAAAKTIASGNLKITLRERSANDELMQALMTMVNNLGKIISEIQSGVQTLAASSTELSAISTQVVARGASVSEKSSTVAAASEEMTANAKLVAQSMAQTSKNLLSINSSTEEMTSTISDIAHNSEKAMNISKEAVQQANNVVSLMKELGRSAKEISAVTESINCISDQTNMLALNATIEAARAGAAGKGFAVVATEIKELSKQTASATEDIKKRIEAIQTSTGSAITDIDKIAGVIREMSDIVTGVAAAMDQQSTVTRQIADNLAQASAGVQQTSNQVEQTSKVCQSITADVVSVSTSAKEMENAGGQVNYSAKDLSHLADQLGRLVRNFQI